MWLSNLYQAEANCACNFCWSARRRILQASGLTSDVQLYNSPILQATCKHDLAAGLWLDLRTMHSSHPLPSSGSSTGLHWFADLNSTTIFHVEVSWIQSSPDLEFPAKDAKHLRNLPPWTGPKFLKARWPPPITTTNITFISTSTSINGRGNGSTMMPTPKLKNATRSSIHQPKNT